jgi:hypothetical protein
MFAMVWVFGVCNKKMISKGEFADRKGSAASVVIGRILGRRRSVGGRPVLRVVAGWTSRGSVASCLSLVTVSLEAVKNQILSLTSIGARRSFVDVREWRFEGSTLPSRLLPL